MKKLFAPATSLALLLTALPSTTFAEDIDDGLPIDFDIGGYYRARISRIRNLPQDVIGGIRDAAAHADYGFMRMRLNPSVSYGPDKDLPIAKLSLQIDGLDNVTFGDNDLIADTPVFGDVLSATDIFGVDVDTIQLKRAWLEFLLPVGQMRVGRMGTMWGQGLLAHDGNGIGGDFGDALYGTTNDRILFATRPLTIANVLMGKSAKPTPLILVVAYDKIVEDPFVEATDFRFDPEERPRSELPFGTLFDNFDDVNQVVGALVWSDPKFNREFDEDELAAGVITTHRWQSSSESKVTIVDFFWRWKWSVFGDDGPQLFTEGEVLTIQGKSRAISRGTLTEPNIWGAVGKIGAHSESWDAVLEGGHASGDAIVADTEFKGRALNPDYRVGLVLFPIVLNARTANQAPANGALWSRGGVYNATYFYPHGRWRPLENVEIIGALLLAWADELAPAIGGSQRDDGSTDCNFSGDCFLGVEADAAVKVYWGPKDLMRWSTEAGILKGGRALETVLEQDLVWTLQSRIAMVF